MVKFCHWANFCHVETFKFCHMDTLPYGKIQFCCYLCIVIQKVQFLAVLSWVVLFCCNLHCFVAIFVLSWFTYFFVEKKKSKQSWVWIKSDNYCFMPIVLAANISILKYDFRSYCEQLCQNICQMCCNTLNNIQIFTCGIISNCNLTWWDVRIHRLCETLHEELQCWKCASRADQPSQTPILRCPSTACTKFTC